MLKTYTELKGRVLEINPNVPFSPTKYYISIKRRKNHAYIITRKKKMRLIVMRPEEEIGKCISKYEVISLSPNVKKYWNGEWRDGEKNGQATLTFADGRVKKGILENNKFIYAKK